jgi:molecular chaperone Hsp33
MTDRLIRATAAGGGIRAVGAITTSLTEEARVRHRLSAVSTDALGRAMTAGLLLASSMKVKFSRVNIRIKGDGPMGGLMVDAGANGTVRGYVNQPKVEVPLTAAGKLDVGGAIGSTGFVYVFRDLGYGRPYSSTVDLISGEIGDDIAHYLFSSEQTPSGLVLGVSMNANGVQSAGGVLIQVHPKPHGMSLW